MQHYDPSPFIGASDAQWTPLLIGVGGRRRRAEVMGSLMFAVVFVLFPHCSFAVFQCPDTADHPSPAGPTRLVRSATLITCMVVVMFGDTDDQQSKLELSFRV